jgi:hypothetical protein
MLHAQRFFPGFLLSSEHPVARAVPLGAAGVRVQHAVGHHSWVRMNPMVLPHLPAADDEPPSTLNHKLLRASYVNPD